MSGGGQQGKNDQDCRQTHGGYPVRRQTATF